MSLSKICGSSLLVFLVLGVASEASVPAAFSRTQLLFGDVPVSITIRATEGGREKALRAMSEAFEVARKIGDEVSEFVPTSDVSRLNRSGLEGATVGRHLLKILRRARTISEMTDGAFDVTFASMRKGISYRDILIDQGQSRVRFSRPGVRIGVSGIAKGTIVDEMGKVLKRSGFRNFLVNAGGDVFAHGSWEVGIADPRSRTRQSLCTLTLRDRAVSTSGNYERGKHIIDPRTHKPVSHYSSVTVIADESWRSDALGTAFFVGRKDEIGRWLKKRKDVEVILIGKNGRVFSPSGSSSSPLCVSGCSRW